MTPCRSVVLAIAIFATAFLPASGLPQISDPPLAREASGGKLKPVANAIHVQVQLVLVNVTVLDPNDHPVLDLQKGDFRLFEDKVERELVTFSHEDAPISIGIIFDISASMADKVDKTKQAALQVLKTANPQDEFFLITFNARARLKAGFTSSLEELQNSMISMKPKGSTALLDAIHLGMKEMKQARYRRHALIVVSDGGDNNSLHSESRIVRDLKEADCQVYAMGIFDQHDMMLTVEERNGPELLSKLAEITGGRAFSVSNLDALPDIASKIGMELRDQYVLGYKPGSTRPGNWRSIKVEVNQSANLPSDHIYARSGYYAPRD